MIRITMNTFHKKFICFVFQSNTIFKIALLSILLTILNTKSLCAQDQGKITGFVVDEEFNEPLEKAVVTIPGTLISVITDQQGKYTLKLIGGEYSIEVNCPGFYMRRFNISVSDRINTPMFIVKLKTNQVGRTKQRRISTYENKRQVSQSTENFNSWQIAEQTGHQEFNEILKTIPSASFLSNGSGFNDSEVSFRGNAPTLTSYTLNGILLNNPENGRMSPAMLSGLTDWTGQIQAISGQAANLQSQTKYGGLVNVMSFTPRDKAGGDVFAIYGNEGFLKTSATAYSGLSRKGLASSVQLSRTSGNGLVQNSGLEQYGIFIAIQKEFSHMQSLVFNLNAMILQHDRNSADSIGAYNRYGTNYNAQWGKHDGMPTSWSTNYARSPLISLTHFWQPRPKTHITSQLFAQFNRSAQLLPGGSFNNQPIEALPKDSEGQLPFDKITDWNKGLAVSEMGSSRIPDANGKFINSENSGITTLAAIDRDTRLGLRSVFTHNLNKKLELLGSFDLLYYHASHFGAVQNLLGADGYTSLSNVNQATGAPVEKLFQPKLFTSYNSVDKSGHYYESGIQTGGISFRVNYQLSHLYWYLGGSASLQNIRRTDHFSYLATDPDRKTDGILLPGGHAQTGLRFSFWKYHSIYLNTSYGSYQSLFTTLFPSGNNWKNQSAKNEQVFDSEFGYTILSRRLKIEALAYRSQMSNRSIIRYSNLNPGDAFGVVNGLSEIHQGVELKTAYKITKNIQLSINGSYGDWKYTKDAKAQIYDLNNQMTAENDLGLKAVYLPNAPQFGLFAEFEWRLIHNLYLRANYYRADKIYAPFSLYDFKGQATQSDFKQWQLPSYSVLGFSGNYLLKLRKLPLFNLIFGANNLLNTEYIEQSATNLPQGNSRYTSNQVFYGTGRSWFAGIKIQF